MITIIKMISHLQSIKGVQNTFFKKWAFNFLLKLSIEMDSLIYLGRTFHNLGAANRKARSPRVALGLTFG